jgi:hypothetical protein
VKASGKTGYQVVGSHRLEWELEKDVLEEIIWWIVGKLVRLSRSF